MSATDKALKLVDEAPAGMQAAAVPPPFTADAPGLPGASPKATFLAELLLHGRVATPLAVGLFGPPGSGKTSLLGATLAAVSRLRDAAEAAGLATPFEARTATVAVTLQPDADPAATILVAVHDALAPGFPDLVGAAMPAMADTDVAAAAARDRLDGLRQRLDEERRKLDGLAGRQARLTETVLFEASGSQVDAYARAHRGRIDRSLRGFGFGPDTMQAYKELVRDAAEAGPARAWLPAFWAYRGQTRLIVAVCLFVLVWLLGLLIDDQGPLLDTLRGSGDRMGTVADWLAAHVSWLGLLRQVAGLAGVAALALNALRAVRFAQPIARGARLLDADLETRRRDLDGFVAHQAQRVEALAREAEQASARAAEAERAQVRAGEARAGEARPPRRLAPAAPPSALATARDFMTELSAAMTAPRNEASHADAPARLVVAIDGFERLSEREAAVALEAVHDLLSRPGMTSLVALDRAHVTAGFADADPALATAKLDRVVQVPVRLSAGRARDLVQALLTPSRRPGLESATTPDTSQSALDRPWLAREVSVLEAVAPYAGDTPRAVKRLVNLYRVARADPAMAGATAQDHAALALGLALQQQGVLPEGMADDGPLDGAAQATRNAASVALGTSIETGQDSRGFAVARGYQAV